jgi:hypothetical protein
MPKSIFLSHNWHDKPFARRLAADLSRLGVSVWVDEAEIQLGDSLIEKIRVGIDGTDFVAVILSPDSIQSPWVQHEIDVAMNQEIEGKAVKVLPLLYRQCELPGFLKGKLYADFSDESKYASSLRVLLRRLEVDELQLPEREACDWQRVAPSQGCANHPINGIAFCAKHLAELEERAIEAMQRRDGHLNWHVDEIRPVVVFILSVAGAITAETLVKYWDFIWSHIFVVRMFPPGFTWRDADAHEYTFLGRPSRRGSDIADNAMDRIEAGYMVDEILRRLPI